MKNTIYDCWEAYARKAMELAETIDMFRFEMEAGIGDLEKEIEELSASLDEYEKAFNTSYCIQTSIFDYLPKKKKRKYVDQEDPFEMNDLM